MIRILCGLSLLIILVASPGQAQPKPLAHDTSAHYIIKPIKVYDRTWGYIIYMDGMPFIRQTSIPALPGNRGFSSRDRAKRAAELMVDKLRRGQMPPSLTKEELQQAKLI